ncbi:MAG: primosomal protein N' [Candidatus Tectomicrobia bacterium]|nr:primosomal protein N' [Candidatus Tectomicrobia bacterium]
MARQAASPPSPTHEPPYADVAVPAPLHQLYTYAIPAALRGCVAPGSLVEVPFGRRRETGYVVELVESTEVADVKPIRRLLEPQPVLDAGLLDLARAVAAHYLTPLGLVLKTALPGGLGRPVDARLWSLSEAGRRLLPSPAEQAEGGPASPTTGGATALTALQVTVLAAVGLQGPCDVRQLEESLEAARDQGDEAPTTQHHGEQPAPPLAALLGVLARRGLVRGSRPRGAAREHRATFFTLAASEPREGAASERAPRLGPRQRAVLDLLARQGEMEATSLNAALPGGSAVARRLAERRLVRLETRRARRIPFAFGAEAQPVPDSAAGAAPEGAAATPAQQPHTLTDAQRDALAAIEQALRDGRAATFLVHGVTGSGKTELYLHAINLVLERQRGAIVLVPEIVLTPQLVERFHRRFGELVALLHSGLSAGERLDEWDRVRRGEARVVVGVRSAVFAPVRNLGIIVIDEEQENSYKQEEGVLYDAREVAELRAAQAGAVLVRGSATPTLEAYHAARRQPGAYLALPERVTEHPLPEVAIVDMRRQPRRDGPHAYLSWPLLDALAATLERGGQSVLFLNRRGFSTAVICFDCGCTLTCRDCSVALTYHRPQQVARCHYCDYQQAVPDLCPDCRGVNLAHRGFGTQQLEAVVRETFPHARVQRMDRDTTRHRRAYHTVLSQLARGRLDILIGTQMVAKGHDYPGITLVGVISADALLSLPDFRAAARTFQLLTQVAGRAGRGGTPGRVIVQSYNPGHYAIACAQQHDYAAFYAHEIAMRRAHFYPPFSHLVLVRLLSRDDKLAMQAGTHLAMRLRKDLHPPAGGDVEVLGPAPAVLARLKGRYRWHLLLKASDADWLRRELHRVLLPEVEALQRRAAVHVDLDLNPQNML